jgi:hypothetical protein
MQVGDVVPVSRGRSSDVDQGGGGGGSSGSEDGVDRSDSDGDDGGTSTGGESDRTFIEAPSISDGSIGMGNIDGIIREDAIIDEDSFY